MVHVPSLSVGNLISGAQLRLFLTAGEETADPCLMITVVTSDIEYLRSKGLAFNSLGSLVGVQCYSAAPNSSSAVRRSGNDLQIRGSLGLVEGLSTLEGRKKSMRWRTDLELHNQYSFDSALLQ